MCSEYKLQKVDLIVLIAQMVTEDQIVISDLIETDNPIDLKVDHPLSLKLLGILCRKLETLG